jgi:hypothetical protein
MSTGTNSESCTAHIRNCCECNVRKIEKIKNQKKNNFERAVELVRHGWLPDGPTWNDFKSDFDALDKAREIFAEKKIKEFVAYKFLSET